MRVNYVRGTTVDRDFVHWRMAPFFAGLLTITPGDPVVWIGFSLDQFMQISWRIKSWKLSGSFSFIAHFNSALHAPLTATYTELLTDAPIVYQKILNITQPSSGVDPFLRPIINGTPALNEGEIMDFANPKFREWTFGSTWTEVIPPVFATGNILTPIGGVEGIAKALSNDAQKNVGVDNYDLKNSWTTANPDDLPFIDQAVTGSATLDSADTRTAISFRALHTQPFVATTGVIPQERVYFDPVSKKFFAPFMLDYRAQVVLNVPVEPPSGSGFFIDALNFGLANLPFGGGTDVAAGNLTIDGLGGDPIVIPIRASSQSANGTDIMADFVLTPDELWSYS